MAHKSGEYRGALRPTGPERERLRLLAEGLDPGTRRWLHELGIAPGWACLEVGAAAGSMARWMAEQTAPGGRVVAADIDTRFLDDVDHPAVEVRRLDIRTDALERDAFDLAYCRTILLHLEDHEAALARMRDALVPGGVLFAQEPDLCLYEAADPDHPDAELFARFHRALYGALRERRRMDSYFGRTLPRCFARLGLEDVQCRATASYQRGGDAGARSAAIMTGGTIGPPLVEAGILAQRDLDRVLELYRDPSFEYLAGLQVAVWGRRTR